MCVCECVCVNFLHFLNTVISFYFFYYFSFLSSSERRDSSCASRTGKQVKKPRRRAPMYVRPSSGIRYMAYISYGTCRNFSTRTPPFLLETKFYLGYISPGRKKHVTLACTTILSGRERRSRPLSRPKQKCCVESFHGAPPPPKSAIFFHKHFLAFRDEE